MAPLHRRRKRRLLLLVVGSFIIGHVVYQQSIFFNLSTSWMHQPIYFDLVSLRNSSPVHRNQSCQLPTLEPFDPAILSYLQYPRPMHCKWRQSRLTLINQDGVLQFNQSALDESGYSTASLSCYYQPIIRPEGQDDVTVYGPKQLMTGRDRIDHEYVYVACTNSWSVTVYKNMHAYPRTLHPKPTPRKGIERKPSVLVFGVDSLSHMNAIRYLPNTYWYLVQNMGAHIMHGMTRIGDNTWPNTVAMFTGKSVYGGELPTLPLGKYYDDYPVIWKRFASDSDYVTMLAEDVPEFTMFNHFASGFRKPPTDHYLRPFWVALESSYVHKMSSAMCFGAVPKHVLQLDYVRDFVVKYRHVPYFAFSMLTEVGHNSMSQVGAADADFVAFLHHLHQGGILDDTILFFLGDHGHRIDPIRLTASGKIDINMPFSAVVLPPSIRTHFPSIVQKLRINSKRLTSMYDYHATFMDILRYTTGERLLGEETPVYSLHPIRRAYSLFETIRLDRTCDDADIPVTYCHCKMEELELDASDQRAKTAANLLLSKLNSFISNYTNICATWTISQIKSAIISYSSTKQRASTIQDVVTTIETLPGKALFEGIVRMIANNGSYSGEVVGEVSRVNRYKGQDGCVTSDVGQASHFDLRKYCYCL